MPKLISKVHLSLVDFQSELKMSKCLLISKHRCGKNSPRSRGNGEVKTRLLSQTDN